MFGRFRPRHANAMQPVVGVASERFEHELEIQQLHSNVQLVRYFSGDNGNCKRDSVRVRRAGVSHKMKEEFFAVKRQ